MSDQHDETKPTWNSPDHAAAPPVTPRPTLGVAGPTQTPAVPIAPVAGRTARKRSGAWVNVLLGVAAAVAVGGVAFAVGRSTAPGAETASGRIPNVLNGGAIGPGSSFAPGGFQGSARGPFSGGLTIDGTVESIDATSMTVKLASGASMTVALDGSTTYHQATSATSSDVTTGDDVAVRVSGGGRFAIGNGNGNGNGNGSGNGDSEGNGNGANREPIASDVTVSK